MKKKQAIINNLFKQYYRKNQNDGYTLIEILTVLAIFAILTAVAEPNLVRDNSATADIDAQNQVKTILQQVRGRAISNTSAVRLRPDPSQPDNKFLVEIAQSRGCTALTKLTEDTDTTTKILKVISTKGFSVNDKIKIGSDSDDNNITDTSDDTITLGDEIGTVQKEKSIIELKDNWSEDRRLQGEDVTLPLTKDKTSALATFTADLTDWTLCFNSRGVAYIFDENNNLQPSLELTITNVTNNEEETITINQGGAIE